jgi:lipid-A-disaccharide synthase
MRYYIIAGEASGDLHGSNLVKQLKQLDSAAEFRGLGGDMMDAAGVSLLSHYKDIAYMGFKEVALHLGNILQAMKRCKNDMLNFDPDVLILIDYPGFNLRISRFAKEHGIKVVYYISPQIWAWKAGRIKDIRAYVDKMICILPFEKDYYAGQGYESDYVGHPLLDHIGSFKADENFLKTYSPENKAVIAVLPGSRKQEIDKILPVLASVQKDFPGYQFIVAATPNFSETYYRKLLQGASCELVFDNTYNLLAHAEAGLITSGTATLEAALFKLPLVVCYKTTGLTYRISRRLIKVKFISLVNLILDKAAVKELIQDDLNAENIRKELSLLLTDTDYKNEMLKNLDELEKMLGYSGASARAAGIIQSFSSQ